MESDGILVYIPIKDYRVYKYIVLLVASYRGKVNELRNISRSKSTEHGTDFKHGQSP